MPIVFQGWGIGTVTVAVTSIEYGTIVIADTSGSNTATITSVDTDKANVILLGTTVDADQSENNVRARVALTNATTVTATRVGTAGTVTVSFVVVEWANPVSIQAGTIAFLTTTDASRTATITAVDTAKSIVFHLGEQRQTTNASTGNVRVTLTDSTTVTATRGAGSSSQDTTVGYVVVEF